MQKFGKEERLCSATDIQTLFDEGKQIFRHPVKLIWMPVFSSEKQEIKVLISVSKRNFKHATDRNRIKRVLREIYRMHKSLLYNDLKDKSLHIAIIFVGKKLPGFKTLEPIIIGLFQRLISEHEETSG
jgi:ribonuclease P protein component